MTLFYLKSRILTAGTSICMAAFATGLFVAPASAIIVDRGVLTFDSATNLEWLDLTQTVGQSYDGIAAGFTDNTKAQFGFSFATTTQLGQFFTNAGLQFIVGGNFTQDFVAAKALTDLLGITSTQTFGSTTAFFAQGWADPVFTDNLGRTSVSLSSISYNPDNGTGNALASGSFFSTANPRTGVGGFVFRDAAVSAVPLPAALPLYGSGLAVMGFIGWRRKRKTTQP